MASSDEAWTRLGDLAVAQGMVTEAQLFAALRVADRAGARQSAVAAAAVL